MTSSYYALVTSNNITDGFANVRWAPCTAQEVQRAPMGPWSLVTMKIPSLTKLRASFNVLVQGFLRQVLSFLCLCLGQRTQVESAALT